MQTIFKVFVEFVTILLLFYVWFFGREPRGILSPWPEIEPAPPELEGEVATTGLPGKSLWGFLLTLLVDFSGETGLLSLFKTICVDII